MSNVKEISRRRSLAIISHPDAGKTTLTEKLLLYGGAVQLAGSVTARKSERATTSDWMELERKRGISISSTVLTFEYEGYRINLLDTPGHKDFSEDTYRVLTAVDAAVMVVDAGKGVESQTRKLFEVCSRRGIPIFTFVNKLDRPTRDPLELLDEIEQVLGIGAYPVNWPLGTGPTFRGVYDRLRNQVHLYDRTPGGTYRAPVAVTSLDNDVVRQQMDEASFTQAREEIDMLDGAGEAFDVQQVLAGKTTPVLFGSAMNNFGVQLLLDEFLRLSPPPTPRRSSIGVVEPTHKPFSAFIFKMQANTDPRHRDTIAYARIVSGRFEREMSVFHSRTGKKVRLSDAHRLFARDRETIDEAFPGDVLGLVGNNEFRIGDTLSEDPAIVYDELPRFPPECFAYLHNPSTAQFKKFRRGLSQLLEEGVVQSFEVGLGPQKTTVLAAVGPLQFEIVQYRLENEYNAQSRLQPAAWDRARWLTLPNSMTPDDIALPTGVSLAWDVDGKLVALMADDWHERFFADRNPNVIVEKLPPMPAVNAAS